MLSSAELCFIYHAHWYKTRYTIKQKHLLDLDTLMVIWCWRAVGTSCGVTVSSPSLIVWVFLFIWCVCAPGDACRPGAKGRPHTLAKDSSFQSGGSRDCVIIVFILIDGVCALKRHAISVLRMFKMKTCFSCWLQFSYTFVLCSNLFVRRWTRM